MIKFKDLDLLSIGNTIQLVGAIWAGNGKMYLCMFPGEHGSVSDFEGNDITGFVPTSGDETVFAETLNMSLAEWETFLRQTDIMETEVLTEAEDSTVTKAIMRKSTRQISQIISWEVYRRDGYKCRYCGQSDVPLTVDHLVLWEEGGPSIVGNLVAVDKRCNMTRGNLPYAQWLEHPYYKRVSANLTEDQREANRRLVETLDAIPRMLHKQSKRK
jgi:hypothetical protein